MTSLGGGVVHIECRIGAQRTAADEDTVFGVQRGDGVLCVHRSSLRVEAAQLMRLGDALDGEAGRGGAQRQVECARRAR